MLFMDTDILISYNVNVQEIFFFWFFPPTIKKVKTILSSSTEQTQVVVQIWSSGSSLPTPATDPPFRLKVHASLQAGEVTYGVTMCHSDIFYANKYYYLKMMQPQSRMVTAFTL